jgi:hypothetical protein
MIPIKVQCECGQRYAFDVEPVNGQMPYTVACPVCGVDGTASANAIIAQKMSAQPTAAALASAPPPPAPPAAGMRLRTATPAAAGHGALPVATLAAPAAPAARIASVAVAASAPSRSMSHMPAVDRGQAEAEAKAKIFWGDTREQVIGFLMSKSYSVPEATEVVDAFLAERAKTMRGIGFKKIFMGIGLICAPIIGFICFIMVPFFPVQLFAITILAGIWGLWVLVKGIMMFVAPKMDHGDVADQ